ELAVFAGVEKWNVGVGALVAEVDFATVKRFRVDVDGHGALIEFGEVLDFMYRLEGIYISWMRRVEIVAIGGNNFTGAVSGVVIDHTVILHAQAADGRGHPAILVAMIVDAAVLADVPADGHALENFILENQVARVAALGKKTIFVD